MSWPPPKKNAVQIKAGANGTHLIKTLHGPEKTNHGEAFALRLWHVSHHLSVLAKGAKQWK